jgi:hypothetical protein
MVATNKNLLKLIRSLAIGDELRAMRLRGKLVVPYTQSSSGQSQHAASKQELSPTVSEKVRGGMSQG